MRIARNIRVATVAVIGLAALPIACRPGTATPSPSPAAAPSRAQHAGSATAIDAEDIDRMRVARVEELIAGRVPGVVVARRPGGGYALRIRGANTFYGSEEPLYVVDGMPLLGRGLAGALAGIAPADITRIEVLKDAGATAGYGAQGANGVVLITTKRR